MYIQLRIEAQHYRKISIVVCQWICIYNWGLGIVVCQWICIYNWGMKHNIIGKHLLWFVNEYVYTTEDWSTTLEENIYCGLSMNMYIQLRIEAQHYRKTSIVVCQWICIYNWGLKHNIIGKHLLWFVNEYVYTTEDWSTTLEENIYCGLSMNMYIQLRIEAQHYRKTSIVVCQWICIYNWGLKHNIIGKYLLWFVNEYVYTTEDWSTTL